MLIGSCPSLASRFFVDPGSTESPAYRPLTSEVSGVRARARAAGVCSRQPRPTSENACARSRCHRILVEERGREPGEAAIGRRDRSDVLRRELGAPLGGAVRERHGPRLLDGAGGGELAVGAQGHPGRGPQGGEGPLRRRRIGVPGPRRRGEDGPAGVLGGGHRQVREQVLGGNGAPAGRRELGAQRLVRDDRPGHGRLPADGDGDVRPPAGQGRRAVDRTGVEDDAGPTGRGRGRWSRRRGRPRQRHRGGGRAVQEPGERRRRGLLRLAEEPDGVGTGERGDVGVAPGEHGDVAVAGARGERLEPGGRPDRVATEVDGLGERLDDGEDVGEPELVDDVDTVGAADDSSAGSTAHETRVSAVARSTRLRRPWADQSDGGWASAAPASVRATGCVTGTSTLSRIGCATGRGCQTVNVRTTARSAAAPPATSPSALTASPTACGVSTDGSSRRSEAGTVNENGTAAPAATGIARPAASAGGSRGRPAVPRPASASTCARVVSGPCSRRVTVIDRHGLRGGVPDRPADGQGGARGRRRWVRPS